MNIRPNKEVTGRTERLIDSTPQYQEEAETFIVQNPLPGPHYVSDIGLNFGPFEVVDLTHEDPRWVRGSQNLKTSLKRGLLVRITQDEYDLISDNELARERAEMVQSQKKRRTRTVDINGKKIAADIINLNNVESAAYISEQLSTTGQINDPNTMAATIALARRQAKLDGRAFDAREFTKSLMDRQSRKQDQQLDPALYEPFFAASSTSGVSGKGQRAVYATSPGADGGPTGTYSSRTGNWARDGFLAGASEMGIDSGNYNYPDDDEDDEDMGIAEEINLLDDEEDDEDMGDGEDMGSGNGLKRLS